MLPIFIESPSFSKYVCIYILKSFFILQLQLTYNIILVAGVSQ